MKLTIFFFIILFLQQLSIAGQYESKSGCEKRDLLWKHIEETEFRTLPKLEKSDVWGMVSNSLKPKFYTNSDFRPKGWKKYIHRRSVVAKIGLKSLGNHPFSGIWKDKNVCGLIRMSLTYKPEKRGFAPGIAIKLFVDKKPSLDISLLTSLDSQGQNYNFFEKNFSNIVPLSNSLSLKFISWIFSKVDKRTNFISIEHLSQRTANGHLSTQIISPLQIFAESLVFFPSMPARDFREDFLALNYKNFEMPFMSLYANLNDTKEKFAGKMTLEKMKDNRESATEFSHIILDSNFKASSFGDDQLFFKHKRF